MIDRAAADFGISPGSHFEGLPLSAVIVGVDFYKPEDEVGVQRAQPWQSTIRLVDDEGSASWAVPWYAVRYRELLEAADSGLIEGDPLRPYLWPVIPQGDVGVLLQDLLWLLERNYAFVLKSAAGGTIAGISSFTVQQALERLRQFRRARERDDERWYRRLERPDDFMPLLQREPMSSEAVAELLRCSEVEAAAAMWGLGFVVRRTGRRLARPG